MSSSRVHPEERTPGGSSTSLAAPLMDGPVSTEEATKKKSVFFLDAAAAAGKGVKQAFGAIERGAGEGARLAAQGVKLAGQGAEAVAKKATAGAEALNSGANNSIQSVLRAKSLAKRVERMARQQALVHFSTVFKLIVFFAINASLMVWLFVLARFSNRYLSAEQSLGTVSATYSTDLIRTSGSVTLHVNDYYIPQQSRPGSSASAIPFLVHLPSDAVGDPGWNMQDITNTSRTFDAALTYYEPDGKRMIQNYRRCRARCLVDGRPADLAAQARNYTYTPYGYDLFDFYLNRDWFFANIDPDYFAAYHNPNVTELLRDAYSNWGQTRPLNDIKLTAPTDSKFICNLGAPRRRLTAIVVRTSACHVQIASHAGSDYSLLVRGRDGVISTPTITETVTSNSTTGCQTFELTIDVRGNNCRTSSVPGIRPSCEDLCALVLFKGQYARRLPIRVVADVDPAVDPSTLHIDDRFLVLDTRAPWDAGPSTEHDLSVLGGSIVVDLKYARIGNLLVQAGSGRKSTSFLSTDVAYFNSTFDDDVVIEDNRNTLLLYRNPNNYVCAASPLVEQIPADFLMCDALDTGYEVHKFYEVSVDGVIDKKEFSLGLEKLGISFDSLGFTLEEQQAVLDHVFTAPDLTEPLLELAPAEVIQRLYTLMPALLTLYDTGDGVELFESEPRSTCNTNCLAAGNSSAYCNAQCTWRCQGAALNITEPTYGLCDPDAGCSKACGVPDWPITRFSTARSGVSLLPASFYDTDGNGLMGYEELRGLLLRLHSNCTYKILQTDVTTSATPRYCAIEGEGQFQPGTSVSSLSLNLNCNYTTSNPADWRINNLPASSTVAPSRYGSSRLPRECRPFPDYDPRLSGKVFDPTARRSSCPECFLLDGTRVPPEYYNRSTWSRERYDEVMKYVRQVLTPKDVAGAYVPYFNLSDDTQFAIFANKLLATVKKADRVDYNTFNLNIQTLSHLDFLGPKHVLFNPWCFNGQFLKIKPDYVSGDSAVNQAAIAANSIILSETGSGLVLSSNMPGFNMSTSPAQTGLLPCSYEWGNGTQGSTRYSYFAWANASIGFKWGKALPEYCFDEKWPDGGVDGYYPDDWSVYGDLAGRPILPGCEMRTCLPNYFVENGFGSIHVQVLPFTGLPEPEGVDWWNATGHYQRMVDNCMAGDGTRKCFYQGYSSDAVKLFSPTVLPSYKAIMQPCVDQAEGCSDMLVVLSITGEGVPTHQKWFWVSRRVYMEVEPPFFYIMSAGTLSPDVKQLKMRMSPGFCSAEHGAVETIDWRDIKLVGSNADTVEALRTVRNKIIYKALFESLPKPTDGAGLSPNSGWYVKQVWRDAYTNESLFTDPSTADELRDTAPGYVDPETGQHLGVGAFWRHRRVCYDPSDCATKFFTYRDNCLVKRVGVYNATSNTWSLSPCAYPNGTTAYYDPNRDEYGGTFNETAYSDQFAMNITDYEWYGMVEGMSHEDHLKRNYHLYTLGYSADNVTSYFFTKLEVSFNDEQEVQFSDAATNATNDIPLLLSIIFSILIAATCGLGVVVAIVFFGFKYLAVVNQNMEMQKKVKLQRITERHEGLFDQISEAKAELVAKYRLKDKERALRAAQAAVDAEQTTAEKLERDGPQAAATSNAEPGEEDELLGKQLLSVEERTEILYVMAQNDFTDQNVHRWNLHDMQKLWRDEVKRRKPNLRFEERPEDRCTLLPTNRLEDEESPEDGAGGVRWWHKVMFWREHDQSPEDAGKSTALRQAEKAEKAKAREEARIRKEAEERERERRIMMSGNFVQRMSYANILKVRRVLRSAGKIFSHSFPSPLKVLDQVLVNEVRIRLFNSLHTFLKVKCKVNHQLLDGEQIILGMLSNADERHVTAEAAKLVRALKAEVKRVHEATGVGCTETSLLSKSRNLLNSVQQTVQTVQKVSATPSDDLVQAFQAGAHRAPARSRGPVGEGKEDQRSDSGPSQGHCQEGHRSTKRESLDKQKAEAGEEEEEDTLEHDELRHFEIDGVGDGVVCVKSDDFKTELYAVNYVHISVHKIPLEASAETGALAVAEELGKGIYGLVTRILNMLTSTVTGKVATESGFAHVVVIQEGAGAVLNDKAYQREEDERDAAPPDLDTSDNHSANSDSGKFWLNRTLVLPCPAMPTLDGNGRPGVLRTYMINEVNGPSYITINTTGSITLEDHNPVVEFNTTRRGFNIIYERWCAQNGLVMREVLDEEGFLADVNIQIKKRVVPRIKGLKLLHSNLRAAMETFTQQQEAMDQIIRTQSEAGVALSSASDNMRRMHAMFADHQLFERGEEDRFTLVAKDVGRVHSIKVRSSGDGTMPGWYLQAVAVYASGAGQFSFFPCGAWLDPHHGLEKELLPEEGIMAALDAEELYHNADRPYTITVHTSDTLDTGSHGEVSIELYGDKAFLPATPLRTHKGNFQQSCVDEFVVYGPDIGELRKMAITFTPRDSNDKWHLAKVQVQSPLIAQPYVFHMDSGFDASSQHGQPVRKEFPVTSADGKMAAGGQSTYKVTVRTGNLACAGTDSHVFLTVYGEHGDTGELELRLECEDLEATTTLARPLTREGQRGSSRGRSQEGGHGQRAGQGQGVDLSRESMSSKQGARKNKVDKFKKLLQKKDAQRSKTDLGVRPCVPPETSSAKQSVLGIPSLSGIQASAKSLFATIGGKSLKGKPPLPRPAGATGSKSGKLPPPEQELSRFSTEIGAQRQGGGGGRAPDTSAFAAASGLLGETLTGQLQGGDASLAPAHNPIFEALMRSKEPFALFLQQQCELTANFASDFVDLDTLTFSYNNWLKHQQFQEAAAKLRSGPSGPQGSSGGGAAPSVRASMDPTTAGCAASAPPPASTLVATSSFGDGPAAGSARSSGSLANDPGSGGSSRSSSNSTRSATDKPGSALTVQLPHVVMPSPESPELQASPFLEPTPAQRLWSAGSRPPSMGCDTTEVLPADLAADLFWKREHGRPQAGSNLTDAGSVKKHPRPVAEGEEDREAAFPPPPAPTSTGGGAAQAPTRSDAQLQAPAAVGLFSDLQHQPITQEAVERFGLKYADEDVYELVGVIVDLKDLLDDPEDANRLLTIALDAITVVVHTVFIWALAVPLVLTFVGFQAVYEETTAVEHLLTMEAIRIDPTLIEKLYLFNFLKNILIFALAWIMFCYLFLIIHYVFGPDGRNHKWHIILRTIFWLYLTVMVALLVAYVFEIITWIILGAVINPNKYLPYSVATITLLAHTQATYMRLMKEFAAFKDKVKQVVMDAFINKLRAAIEVAQKAVGTATAAAGQWQADVMNSGFVQKGMAGMDAVSAFGNFGPGGPFGQVPSSGGLGFGAGFLQSLAEIPSAPAPHGRGAGADGPGGNGWSYAAMRNMLPFRGHGAYQRVATSDDDPPPGSPGPEGAAAHHMQAAGGHAQAAVAGVQQSVAGMSAYIPAYVPQQYMAYAPYMGALPGQQVPGMPSMPGIPGVGGSSSAGGGPETKPMNPYEIFKLYAKEDEGLDYNGFGRLLDHLEIQLIGDKRRELFVRFASATGRHTMGYKDFETCYAVIKETIVLKTLADNGMTRGRFIFLLCYAVFILILIFIFIFVGVAAFTGAGTLGAIVNSLLAAGSGIVLNLKKKNESEENAPVSVKIGDQEYTGGGDNETTVTTAA